MNIRYSLFLISCLFESILARYPFASYAALGDSYATGNGAGTPRWAAESQLLCGRFSDAYPLQLVNDPKANIDLFDFQNLACAGAVTTTVLKTQVPFIDGSDIVTIQVGGNEVDFFRLLNECVQQWHPLSSCELEMERARNLVQSTTLLDNFNDLISGAVEQMAPGSTLFVLGYAHFFNENTKQCNHVSFSRTDPNNVLSQSLRRQFNDMVMLLNDVIRGTSEAHGVIYVDIDELFEGHRFCEKGVLEPAPDASWFFSDVGRASGVAPMLSRDELEQQTLSNPFSKIVNLTRTFHPTSDGHEAIANKIEQLLRKHDRI